MSRSRLFAQHPPAVAGALADLPPDRLAEAVRDVAMVAVPACGVLDLCMGTADLEQLVADLDGAARDARPDGESSDESAVSYEEFFRQAGAANSWRQAVAVASMETAHDSIYEALHALGADASAEAHIIEVLRA